MTLGTVRNREAIIEIEVSGPGQTPQMVNAVIDTGFNGYLTLPSPFVTALQLPFAGYRRGTLADGSLTRLDVYLARVIWHNQPKDVLISQTESTPLVGMSLLEGSKLTIDVAESGVVTIDKSP